MHLFHQMFLELYEIASMISLIHLKTFYVYYYELRLISPC